MREREGERGETVNSKSSTCSRAGVSLARYANSELILG